MEGHRCGSWFLFKTQNLLNADVDGFLCPEHFKELYGLLKLGKIFPQAETAQNEQQPGQK
jgi:hypothetical protein